MENFGGLGQNNIYAPSRTYRERKLLWQKNQLKTLYSAGLPYDATDDQINQMMTSINNKIPEWEEPSIRRPIEEPIQGNLLLNPSFEEGIAHWNCPYPEANHIVTKVGSILPQSGTKFFISYIRPGFGNGGNTSMYQQVEINSACTGKELKYGGYTSGWTGQSNEPSTIRLEFIDSANSIIDSVVHSGLWSNNTWVLREHTYTIPSNTRYIKYYFETINLSTQDTDGYLDSAFMEIQ